MASSASLPPTTIKVLYNNSYGAGFSVSDAFRAEYKVRSGRDLDPDRALFRIGPHSMRCDPIAVTLVEERGTEWASGPGSAIELYEFPAIFDRYWSIEESDGDESIHVDVNAALADCLQTYMETRDLVALEAQYAAIMGARSALFRSPLEPAEPVDATPPVLKPPTCCGATSDGSCESRGGCA